MKQIMHLNIFIIALFLVIYFSLNFQTVKHPEMGMSDEAISNEISLPKIPIRNADDDKSIATGPHFSPHYIAPPSEEDVWDNEYSKKSQDIELDPFEKLSNIEVKAKDQLKIYYDYLSDDSLVSKVEKRFLEYSSKFNQEEEDKRINGVHFLKEALIWLDHPNSEQIKDKIINIIEDDRFFSINDLRQKKSLAGDKIDLFLTLKRYDKSAADSILARQDGKPIGLILNFYQNRS